MTAPAVRVEQLGKSYRLGLTHAGSVRELVNHAAARLLGRPPASAPRDPRSDARTDADGLFWALRDVSFEVQPGEVVGIIGRNGAGKSTLLKILSRITPPTTGRVDLHGRVASLLEVGTGFHPELTGRENIYLNGTILGLTRAEVTARLDEIVAFAEVDQFLDTPVKRYSSGMTVRLAFAVAAHLDPEILIIDEVLAVGDAAFQRKCLNKMKDVAGAGRTVLFVSHNMVAVKSLCDRAAWLEDGLICALGDVSDVTSAYLSRHSQTGLERSWKADETASGGEVAWMRSLRIRPQGETGGGIIPRDVSLDVHCEFETADTQTELHLALVLYDEQEQCVFASGSPILTTDGRRLDAICEIPGGLLKEGFYRIDVLLVRDGSVTVGHPASMTFQIEDTVRTHRWYGEWPGIVRPELSWDVQPVPCPDAAPRTSVASI